MGVKVKNLMQPRKNIELKARCRDLAAARRAALNIGARRVGLLVQSDTYFKVPSSRLKLRQIEGSSAELIWYARPNDTAFRASSYIVTPISDAPTALAALSSALSVRGVIRKVRELWMLDNVRIHLDEVEQLGHFIEFEAVIDDAVQETSAEAQLKKLCDALAISSADRVGLSYSDLLGF